MNLYDVVGPCAILCDVVRFASVTHTRHLLMRFLGDRPHRRALASVLACVFSLRDVPAQFPRV